MTSLAAAADDTTNVIKNVERGDSLSQAKANCTRDVNFDASGIFNRPTNDPVMTYEDPECPKTAETLVKSRDALKHKM